MTIRNFATSPSMCTVVFHLYGEATHKPYQCELTHGLWGDTEIAVRHVGEFRLCDGGTAWHARPVDLISQIESFIGQSTTPWPVEVCLTTDKEWFERGDSTYSWLEWASEDRSMLVQLRDGEASLFDGNLTGEGYVCTATVKGVQEGTPVNVVLSLLMKQVQQDLRRKLR